MIPFASFEPDRATYAPGTSPTIRNAIPVADGYAPMRDLAYISSALAAECKGAVRVRTPAGVIRVFAGTAAGLFELDGSDYSWADVSGPSAPYAVPDDDEWSFAVFGDYLIACNIADPPQFIAITGGTAFADLSGSPPQAKYVWTAGEYLFLGHINGSPTRIQCSGIGDAAWWDVGQKGADFQDFPDGGEVTGAITAPQGAIVFQRDMIRQINIVQIGDYSFTTSVLNPGRGAVAPLSIVQIGPGQFFYYSADGFMLGVDGRPIGAERVDKWFRFLAGTATVPLIKSTVDPINKVVWTAFQQGVDFLLGYNWQLDRWCYSDIGISRLVSMAAPTRTWDSYSIAIDDFTDPFDANPGNQDQFAAFDTSNRLCFFTGSNRAATLETADLELVPGRRAWLSEIQTLGECANYTVQVGSKDNISAALNYSSATTPYSSTAIAHFRKTGRWHRVRVNIPYGADWRVISGVEPLFREEGRR